MTRENLIQSLFISLIFVTSFSQVTAEEFEPHFKLKLGLSNGEIDAFDFEGQQLSASSSFSAALEYRYSETWSASVLYSHASDCFIFCAPVDTNISTTVIDTDYSVELYQLTMLYNRPISDKLTGFFNFGLIVAEEAIDLRVCDDYRRSGFTGGSCNSDWLSNETSNTEYAPLIGGGLNYQMSKSWDIQANIMFSGLREGYYESGVFIGYRF